MSDYTPTTDEVRRDHLRAGSIPHFDRWLASVKAEAWDEGYRNGLIYDNPYREA